MPAKNEWVQTYWPGDDFVPARVKSGVTLFKVTKQPFYYKPDPLMGWGSRTASGVDIHILPTARHRILLREPYVRELAEALCDQIQRIRSQALGISHKNKQVESAEVTVGM